jgi:alkaline phosphatase D
MAELILGPIVGGLAANRVHLWGRADAPATLYAWLGEQSDLEDARLAGQSLPLQADNGFAGVAPIYDLLPATRYYYALTFSAAPPSPADGPYPSFTTFPPDGEPTSFNFAFGSCFRPADENGGQIFRILDERRQQDDLRFALLIGDQIYADAHPYNGIGKIACTLDEYRAVYAYTWSRPPFRELLYNLPVFMTLDDHEVDDDWQWHDHTRQWARLPPWDNILRWLAGRPPQEKHIPRHRVQQALQAYWEHQAMHAPSFLIPPQINRAGHYTFDPDDQGSLAYTFSFGAAAFFVLDTRTQRVKNRRERMMLGPMQWEALEKWLLEVKEKYALKFLVTSCALLFDMWADFPRDRWSGFRDERARLISFLAQHGIEGVYLLAGDLHASHAVYAELYGPQGKALPVWEFCSSPFEQATNWAAKYTRWPLRGGPIKRQKLICAVARHNFGLVRVDLANPQNPQVRFEIYGDKGELLGKAGG